MHNHKILDSPKIFFSLLNKAVKKTDFEDCLSGTAYGFYSKVSDFIIWCTLARSLLVFGRSLKFVLLPLLLALLKTRLRAYFARMPQGACIFINLLNQSYWQGFGSGEAWLDS